MIRPDFPYLPGAWWPIPGTVGNPATVAAGRILSGHGFADDETGDTDSGAWFARIDARPGQTLAEIYAEAAAIEPEAADLRAPFDSCPDRSVAGIIYGRDSEGFEFAGAWADADRFARVWNHLSGAWAEPDSGFAIRAAANESRHRVRFGHGVRVETAEGFRGCSICFRLVGDSGADILIQTDTDFPGVAGLFGWRPRGPLGCECYRETDGTTACPACGKSAADFISEASEHIEAVAGTGIRAEDPGYFDTPDGSARG